MIYRGAATMALLAFAFCARLTAVETLAGRPEAWLYLSPTLFSAFAAAGLGWEGWQHSSGSS